MTQRTSTLSRLTAAATVCVALISSPAVRADSARPSRLPLDDGYCGNRTLHGKYAFTVEGVFLDGAAVLPLRGVAMTSFDGKGNLTQVDHVVFAGMLPPVEWTPATGTYTLNPDCTGEAEIIIPGSPFSPVTLRLVVANNGSEIRTVVSKPGYVVTSTATKVAQPK